MNKIDKLYILDNPNHQRYYHGTDWFVSSKPVKSETSRSYVLDNRNETKVNKKTLLGTPDYTGIQEQYFLTKEEAEDYIWYKNNRRKILQKLEYCRDIQIWKDLKDKLGA